MQLYSIVAVLALAFSVNAAAVDMNAEPNALFARANCQAIANKVPQCAQSCINPHLQAHGCNIHDLKCGCRHAAAIANEARQCVINRCGIQKALKAQKIAQKVCRCVNH